jgi:hypothetical protein
MPAAGPHSAGVSVPEPGPTTTTQPAGSRDAARLNHAKMTRLRDCTTAIRSRIFMPEAWSSETPKSNEISWDGVFAEHGI